MRFQQVIANNVLGDDDLPEGKRVSWHVSQSDAASKRKALVDQGYRRKDLVTNEVDVPTDKAGLLVWLNENAI